MELGPVAVAETDKGGPEGAASSVRKKTGVEGRDQPTSFMARTSALKAELGVSPVKDALL